MELISQKYGEILAENFRIQKTSLYFSKQYKVHREWHILGAAEAIYRQTGNVFPCYAGKREQPDFDLFDAAGNIEYGLETTTVHPPDRKVHKHHRDWEKQGSKPRIHDDPGYTLHWEWLREGIRKKSVLPYMAASALLVYFNVSLHDTIERNQDDFGLCIREEWSRDSEGCFAVSSLRTSNIQSVHVLSADLRSLATIFPGMRTISI